jgi:hypothetical protein
LRSINLSNQPFNADADEDANDDGDGDETFRLDEIYTMIIAAKEYK